MDGGGEWTNSVRPMETAYLTAYLTACCLPDNSRLTACSLRCSRLTALDSRLTFSSACADFFCGVDIDMVWVLWCDVVWKCVWIFELDDRAQANGSLVTGFSIINASSLAKNPFIL